MIEPEIVRVDGKEILAKRLKKGIILRKGDIEYYGIFSNKNDSGWYINGSIGCRISVGCFYRPVKKKK